MLPLDAWRALEMPVLLLGGETSPAPVVRDSLLPVSRRLSGGWVMRAHPTTNAATTPAAATLRLIEVETRVRIGEPFSEVRWFGTSLLDIP
jgi:hypothetical protein